MNRKLHRLVAALLLTSLASCTTAYDAQGRPRQVMDPGVALLGVAAAGLIAYGIANHNRGNHHHHDQPCAGNGHGYRNRRGYGWH